MEKEPQYALVIFPLELTDPRNSIEEANEKFGVKYAKVMEALYPKTSESSSSRENRGLVAGELKPPQVITVLSESEVSDELLDGLQSAISESLFSEPKGANTDCPRLLKDMEKSKNGS